MSAPRKFRVWDSERKRMIPHEDFLAIHWTDDGDIGGVETIGGIIVDLRDTLSVEPQGTLLQYTGLTDTEGTDVYDSDLVRFEGRICEIQWDGYYADWQIVHPHDVAKLHGDRELTVIGNRYENPKLLEQTAD